MKSGIYRIAAPSGGFYIGSAVNFGARWRQHRYELRNGKHFSKALQRAADKYGIERLVFARLIVCRIEDLLLFEQRAIDTLRPRYNSCPTAGNQLGRRHTEETKRRSSEAKRGHPVHSAEHRDRLRREMTGNTIMVGRKLSDRWRQNIAAGGKGKRHADSFESKLTDEGRAELVRAYNAGKSPVALAKQHAIDHRWMKRILVEAGAILRR